MCNSLTNLTKSYKLPNFRSAPTSEVQQQAAAVTPVRPVRAVSDLNVYPVIREQQLFLEKDVLGGEKELQCSPIQSDNRGAVHL